MKKMLIVSLAVFFVTLMFNVQAKAASGGHGGHAGAGEKAGQAEHSMEHGAKGHAGHMGENIHNATVEGYQLSYHLIDMQKQMAGSGHQMGSMNATHHLMVYVKGPDGQNVEQAKVGYLVVGPNDSKQKLMCMGMQGGFGSDVNFTAKGPYTIKTKAMAGDQILLDEFVHEVK